MEGNPTNFVFIVSPIKSIIEVLFMWYILFFFNFILFLNFT